MYNSRSGVGNEARYHSLPFLPSTKLTLGLKTMSSFLWHMKLTSVTFSITPTSASFKGYMCVCVKEGGEGKGGRYLQSTNSTHNLCLLTNSELRVPIISP